MMSIAALIFPFDDICLQRIINVPKRSIGLTTVGKLQDFARETNNSLFMTLSQLDQIPTIKGKTKEKLEDFMGLIFTLVNEATELSVQGIIEAVLDR